MDLSINKINLNNKSLSFKGLEGAYDETLAPIMRFTAPNRKNGEEVYLEFAYSLVKDPKTNQYIAPDKSAIYTVPFEDSDTLEIEQSWLKKEGVPTGGFAYRFKIVDPNTGKTRYALDSARSMKISDKGEGAKERMNLVEMGRNYGITPKTGSMYHGFLNSVEEDDSKIVAKKVRNHFNKFGGGMSALNNLLEKTHDLDPYRYVMTTPDIGADKVSSHRYWPANHYQCSDLGVFKDFNFNMFKKGKGYVADGAFTSQGIQSPLVQHVLKWGKESPFYNWLKMDPNSDLILGVLPDYAEVDGVNPYDHIGVRLVNPKGEGYDKAKPTYIQFFDDRLLSPEDQVDGKFHFDYTYTPEGFDHYDITTHQDSVQPYAFEVNPNDKKLKAFNGGRVLKYNQIPDKTDFFTFPNFTIGKKNQVGGATCWDGNVDIIKMNLSNPDNTEANRQGFFAAREYLHGVADYWTETIQSHLILETAKVDDSTKAQIAKANNVDSSLGSLVAENFHSLVAKNAKTSKQIIENFPLQTLETSEELSAIFAQPQFREKFLTDKNVALIQKMFDSAVATIADGKGSEYELYVRKTQGNDILRYIFASALNPKAANNGVINISELNKVTLKSLERVASNTPEEERAQVISRLTEGLKKVEIGAFANKAKAKLENVTLGDFKLAEAIVLQGKGGLNWRFDAAKDIGDLDAVRNGEAFDKIWNGDSKTPGVQKFWADFVERIKKYNPSAYVINEVTSLGEFCSDDTMESFDKKLATRWANIPEGEERPYEYKPVYAKQVEFLSETSSTTTSEYSKGFNAFSKFAGVDPEGKDGKLGKKLSISEQLSARKRAGNLQKLKDEMDALMKYNQPDSSILSHMFVSNHDKPSVLHTLPLNMSVYIAEDLNQLDNQTKDDILKLIGKTGADFKEATSKVCPKAVGVGLTMQKVIDGLNCSAEDKEKLSAALTKLVNGQKKEGGISSFKRAEAFGVRPYELTIQDLFDYSGIKYGDEDILNFHRTMMKDSMIYYQRMWQVMNACVGTPTIYAGHEFAQTGYETPSKNEYLGIRNEVLRGLKTQDVYQEYYEQMQEISSLYQKEGLGALRDGAPVSLDVDIITQNELVDVNAVVKKNATGELNEGKLKYFADQISTKLMKEKGFEDLTQKQIKEKIEAIIDKCQKEKPADEAAKAVCEYFGVATDNKNPEAIVNKEFTERIAATVKAEIDYDKELGKATQIWPMFKKNSKGSEVISIITNLGLPKGVASYEQPASETVEYTVKGGIKLSKDKTQFAYELPEGYILKRFGEEGVEYTIENGVLKRVGDVADVVLKDTVTHFYKALKTAL